MEHAPYRPRKQNTRREDAHAARDRQSVHRRHCQKFRWARPNLEFGIANFGFRISSHVPGSGSKIRNSNSEIRNSKDWWRRRELNSDPREDAERLYMLSPFSFLTDKQPDFRFAPSK